MYRVIAEADKEMVVECLTEDYRDAVKIAELLDTKYGRDHVTLEMFVETSEQLQ